MTDTKRSKLGTKRRTPSGRWEVSVASGYRADGRKRVLWATVDTEAEADARILELAAELGRRPDMARGITLAALWDYYLDDKGRRLALKTVRNYTWYMEHVWLPSMGDVDITLISREEVQAVMLTLSRDCAERSRRVLSGVLTYATTLPGDVLTENPIRKGGFELPGDTGSDWEDDDFDDDPFGAIESRRNVWDARTVMRAFPMMRGLPLEAAWLEIVGAGLRVEEALAIRRCDVRRVEIGGREVTQLAVHHARTDLGEVKRTKTRRSVRIVAVMEPFGTRLWELAQGVADPKALVCPVSASNQSKRWRGYFAALDDASPRAKHRPKSPEFVHRGRLASLPYLPLSRMRATHATLMQEAGVLDSVNAAVHGHSEKVAYTNYQRPDVTEAAQRTADYLRLVG